MAEPQAEGGLGRVSFCFVPLHECCCIFHTLILIGREVRTVDSSELVSLLRASC